MKRTGRNKKILRTLRQLDTRGPWYPLCGWGDRAQLTHCQRMGWIEQATVHVPSRALLAEGVVAMQPHLGGYKLTQAGRELLARDLAKQGQGS